MERYLPGWSDSANLKSLNLGVNQLSGEVSPMLSKLASLEELNLRAQ